MEIVQTQKYFEVSFSYDIKKVDALKQIDGAWFHRDRKVWNVPLYKTREINFLRQKFNVTEILTAADGIPLQNMEAAALPELDIEIPILKIQPYEYQKHGIAYCREKKKVIIGDQPGLGKAQPLTAKIATPTGWKLMGEIKRNDAIIGADGNKHFVYGIFPQGLRPCYKITFNDGSFTECDEDHIWTVRDVNRRRRNTGWINKTTKELIEIGLRYKRNDERQATGRKQVLKWEIPLIKPFNFSDVDYVIDPYIFGALLGDGCLTGTMLCISIPDTELEIKEEVEKRLAPGLKLRINDHPSCPQYYITQTGTTQKNNYTSEIEKLELKVIGKDKFIPEKYLFGSYQQRLDLLCGLMDTDGSARNNRITFHSCCRRLAEDISTLVFSLGGQAIIREYDRSTSGKSIEFQVNIKTNFCPFLLQRKVSQWKKRTRNYASRYIESIQHIGEKEQQCISVSAPDKLYLTDSFIVTHNTIQAIATICSYGVNADNYFNAGPGLVICPASLKLNWVDEFKAVAAHRAMILSDKIKNSWQQFYRVGMCDTFIVNYESLKKFFVQPGYQKPSGSAFKLNTIPFNDNINFFKWVVIDESHKCKDPSTMQSKLVMGITREKNIVLELTGTPVLNRASDLVSQLYIVDRLREVVSHIPEPTDAHGKLTDWSGYKRFMKRYCGNGGESINLKELNYRMNLFCFYRREKSEVLKDLPEKIRQVIRCDITNRLEYEKAQNNFVEYLRSVKGCTDSDIKRKLRAEILVQMGILKQVSALGKLEAAREYIDEVISNGQKVVVFIDHHIVADGLKEMYPDALMITGRQSQDERNTSVQKFQGCVVCGTKLENHKDQDHDHEPTSYNVMICSSAGGEGLTLTASSEVLMIEYPWNYAKCEQYEDRTHRISQANSVRIGYLLGDQTIDEYLYFTIILNKKSISQEVTGSKDEVAEEMVDKLLNLFNQK